MKGLARAHAVQHGEDWKPDDALEEAQFARRRKANHHNARWVELVPPNVLVGQVCTCLLQDAVVQGQDFAEICLCELGFRGALLLSLEETLLARTPTDCLKPPRENADMAPILGSDSRARANLTLRIIFRGSPGSPGFRLTRARGIFKIKKSRMS